MVSRPRLVDTLNRGSDHILRLVSGPAGFGKTTLLAEWIATADHPAAWVSLDSRDNNPVLFWAYFISGLQSIFPNAGQDTLGLLFSPQPPPIESLLTTLINEISRSTPNLRLCLMITISSKKKKFTTRWSLYSIICPPACIWSLPAGLLPNFPLRASAPGATKRVAGGRSLLYCRRSCSFPERENGPPTFIGGCRRTGKTYRRLDCRPPVGCVIDTGQYRRGQFCCRFFG